MTSAGLPGLGRWRLSFEAIDPVRLPDYPGSTWRGALGHALLRRIPWLMPTLTFDPGTVLDEARRCPVSPQALHWKDWQRYSSRQKNYQKHGGILGQLRLPTPAAHISHLWPLLWWGQYTHAGKGAVMGLGAYRVRSGGGDNHPFA